MRKLITLVFAVFCIAQLSAQRNVEQSEKISNDQDIFLNFKFAQDITVEQWNKNEVLVKASVNIDEGEGNEAYSLKTSTTGNTLKMYSDFGDYFERSYRDKNRNNCNMTTDINYVVYVPKNASLRVKSISGSLTSNSYKGTLKTELISGDVTIKDYDGALRLKTVSGDLDVTMDKAKIDARTVTGTIYSDLDIDTKNKKSNPGTNKIIGNINNGSELIVLETVSGNIYMRKG